MANDPFGDDAETWDDAASWYDEIVDLLEPEFRKVTQALLDAVDAGPGRRILDVACGPGHVAAGATERGANATGMDRSPAMVAKAKERFPRTHYAVGDMLDPLDGPWDGIVCRFGAHHVDDGWLDAAKDKLVPGGVLAIAEFEPGEDHGHEHGHRHGPDHGAEDSHAELSFRDGNAWAAALRERGYTDVRVIPCPIDIAPLVAKHPELSEDGPNGHAPPMLGRPVFVVAGQRQS